MGIAPYRGSEPPMLKLNGIQESNAAAASILVVDDTAVARDLITAVLRRRGYQILSAADGDEALKIIRKCYPDLIVTDLEMPNVDGQEMIEQIRNSEDQIIRRTPIVVCSSRNDEMTVAEVRTSGANAFLPKPLDVVRLATAVETALP